ncbi:mobile element transfer protein [Streptomyces sp. NBC_01465]|uniref:mobile element transfer protein n=1 Tax=Streptomyces sp. NBC_01465 TaxID=2903878 RepID=UPI002E32AA78|nr:mobile element transfer protein [Streptomyces sp. NBC_01465]
MARYMRFRQVARVGPVEIGTFLDSRGRTKHAAACTAPGCGFSAEYGNRAGAELAAHTHRCKA